MMGTFFFFTNDKCNTDLGYYYCSLVTKLCLTHFLALWTVACQDPLSMDFSAKEYWEIGLPFLSQGLFMTQGLNCISHIGMVFFTL